MNLQNLQYNHHKLLIYMEKNGYTTSYIRQIKNEIKQILSAAESKTWTSYRDIYLEYSDKLTNAKSLSCKLTILGAIENFDIYGQYPNRQQRQKIVQRSKYHLLSSEFKAMIDFYCDTARTQGKKESTIYTVSRVGSSLLLNLQQKGIDSPDKITQEAMLSAFVSPENVKIRGYASKKNIVAVLKTCIPQNPEMFTKILAFVPALRDARKNIQYLQSEEVAKLKKVLTDEKAPLSLRDKAIGILALYTGLRCCDIAGLTQSAVDLVSDRLCIHQKKTGAPLEIPLTAIVGNAIYDYVEIERPDTDCEYIFVTEKYPHRRLGDASIGHISSKVMNIAKIRQSNGARKGFHLFRHHMATELLDNDIPHPVISKALGHIHPDSIEKYFSTNFRNLKGCALSIEQFPMPKGVMYNA